MEKYIPFAAAIAVFLFSPLLTSRAQAAVLGVLAKSREDLKERNADPPPAHLQDSFIKNYIAFAIDAAQVVPAIILTGVATILAIPKDWPPPAGALVMAVTVLAIIAVDTYILGLDPQAYANKKMAGYSLVSLMGILVNLVGILLVAVLGGN